jgi:hypothetical protein
MLQFIYAVFIILHGLVHLWYVTLAQRWVPFESDMGWTGTSWLFSNMIGDGATRMLVTIVYALTTLGFIVAGIGVFANTGWWRIFVASTAIVSSIGILLFWDGSINMIVQKGLLGLLINIALLVGLWILNWPAVRI